MLIALWRKHEKSKNLQQVAAKVNLMLQKFSEISQETIYTLQENPSVTFLQSLHSIPARPFTHKKSCINASTSVLAEKTGLSILALRSKTQQCFTHNQKIIINCFFSNSNILKRLRWNFTVLVLIKAEFFAESQNLNQGILHCPV